MPDKRRADRKSARIRVRFWRPGEPERVQQGYTTNISGTGTFVQTDHPHPKGRRLQVEFTAGRNGFVCEALVARAIKVAPELQSARRGGMGLRFLSVEDLLAGFLPGPKSESGAAGALTGSPAEEPSEADSTEPRGEATEPTETADPPGEIEVATRQVTRHHPAAPPPRRDQTAPSTPDGGNSTSSREPLTFRLTPPNLEVVRALFLQQIEPGVLALPSRTDCEAGLPVRVELKTPTSPLGQRILTFDGEVLECGRADPGTASTLRVRLHQNAQALDFLRRILEIDTSTT